MTSLCSIGVARDNIEVPHSGVQRARPRQLQPKYTPLPVRVSDSRGTQGRC